MSAYEIRERERGDGSGPSLPFLVPDVRLSLAEVLHLAEQCGRTVDVTDGGSYAYGTTVSPTCTAVDASGHSVSCTGSVSGGDTDGYCGASPYWWLPGEHGGGMHQVSSHGWCHDCHKAGQGYMHHLAYEDELAVLANEARHDRVLREQCEADGQTPEQYAAEVAGRAVPLDGDYSFAVPDGT